MGETEVYSDDKLFNAIQVKYILPLLVFVGFMFSLFISFSLSEQQKFLNQELESKGFTLSSNITNSIMLDLLLEDSVALNDRIEDLKSIEIDYKSSAFYNSNHKVISSSGGEIIFPNELNITSPISYNNFDESISIYTPVIDNIDSLIGYFTLTLSKTRGTELIWDSFIKLLLITLGLILMITVLLIFVARRINFVTLNFIKSREISSEELKKKTIRLNDALKKEKHLGEMKTHFVSVASHQFRTPLAIIQSNSELLQMISTNIDPEIKEKMERTTGRIIREISRMTELMDDVLILGKVTSGKMTIEKTKVDLVLLIDDIAQQFNDISQDNRSLDVTIVGVDQQALLDAKMIRHAITNLISNAFKYSQDKNPEVTLTFDSNSVVIAVRDFGIGIPENEQSQLFQPFYRAENVGAVSGTGLGLSITKNYIELNGGTIKLKSALGSGSCFEVTFDLIVAVLEH